MLPPPAAAWRRVLDAALVTAWAALLVALSLAGGRDVGTALEVGLVLTAGACYAAARLVPSHLVPWGLVVMASAGVAVVLVEPGIRSGRPTALPLGYANANGAFLAVCAVAAGAAAVRLPGRWRLLAGLELVVLLAAVVATRSAAAAALALAAATGISLGRLRGPSGRRLALGAAAVVLVAAWTVPVLLGSGYSGPGATVATEALSSRRVDLWRDALDLAGHHPAGGGLGSFPQASPTARADADTRFAHSLPLELAAEAGVTAAGLAVLLGLLLLAAASLRGAPASAWAAAAFGAQAGIDYTYRYPAVVLAAAAVAGLTMRKSVADRPGRDVDPFVAP